MISNEEAIEVLKGDFTNIKLAENETHSDIFAEAMQMAKQALATDIVHCSECRHAKLNWADGEYYCDILQYDFVKDHFCANGERNEK